MYRAGKSEWLSGARKKRRCCDVFGACAPSDIVGASCFTREKGGRRRRPHRSGVRVNEIDGGLQDVEFRYDNSDKAIYLFVHA